MGDGIARVYGLSKVMASELVEFPNDVFGMVLNQEEDSVGIILFGESKLIKEGDTVKRTGRLASMPIGEEMLGRVINPLGQAVDGRGELKLKKFAPVERKALGVVERQRGLSTRIERVPLAIRRALATAAWFREHIRNLRSKGDGG